MMDRRKFLARVAQLAVGVAVMGTGAAELLGSEPLAYTVFPSMNLTEIEALWRLWMPTPDAIWVSPEVFAELKEYAGLENMAHVHWIGVDGLKIYENKHAARGQSGRMPNKFLTARGLVKERMSSPTLPSKSQDDRAPDYGAASVGFEEVS